MWYNVIFNYWQFLKNIKIQVKTKVNKNDRLKKQDVKKKPSKYSYLRKIVKLMFVEEWLISNLNFKGNILRVIKKEKYC